MLHRFHPDRSYWLFVVILSILLASAMLVTPRPIAASCPPDDPTCGTVTDPYSQLGQSNYVINYGSKANIDVVNPNVPSGQGSFMFIQSYYADNSGHQHMMQTGWAKSAFCGSNVVAYGEYTDFLNVGNQDGTLKMACAAILSPGTQHVFYQETNNANPAYWCNGYDGVSCMFSGSNTAYEAYIDPYHHYIGMGNATYVVGYGETSNHFTQMGAQSPAWAGVHQISYKATRTGQINNPIQYIGGPYGACTKTVSTCPYNEQGTFDNISGTNFLVVSVQTK